MKISLVEQKWRRVVALVAALVVVTLFVLFPSMLMSTVIPFPVAPVIALTGLASLLFIVEKAPFVLRLGAKLLLFCAAVFMLFYLTELTSGGTFGRGSADVFMFLLLLAAGVVLYAVTGSLPWAVRLLTVVVTAYSAVNYFVLQFKGTPLIPADVFSLTTALGVLPNYAGIFSAPLAELLLIVLSLFFMAPKLALPSLELRPKILVRAGVGILAAVFLVSTVNLEYFRVHTYTPHFWDQNVSLKENGAALNFVANLAYSQTRRPDDYSLESVANIAGRYPSDTTDSAEVKPDIVLVMGEGWSDMAPQETARTNIPVTPFLDSLGTKGNGLYRDLMVSSYGGGTSYSEFQVLTGANATYGIHQAPFQFNVSDAVPNITSVLKQLGYDTTAMHTGSADAWGRDKAFPLLGFDRFCEAEDIKTPESTYSRYYLSDKNLYDKALSVLDSGDAPQFVYAITIQTHGGFIDQDYESPIKIESPSGDYPMAEQYLGLMHESDADFEDFIAALEQRERPTIVLAYGDHRPALEEDYVNKITVGQADVWRNQTFYVMWANYQLPQTTESTAPVVGLNYLGPKLMEAAQLPLTGYQKFLLEGAEHYPAISYSVYYDAKGNLHPNEQMSDWSYYNDQAVMQYNLVYDQENRADNFFKMAQTDAEKDKGSGKATVLKTGTRYQVAATTAKDDNAHPKAYTNGSLTVNRGLQAQGDKMDCAFFVDYQAGVQAQVKLTMGVTDAAGKDQAFTPYELTVKDKHSDKSQRFTIEANHQEIVLDGFVVGEDNTLQLELGMNPFPDPKATQVSLEGIQVN